MILDDLSTFEEHTCLVFTRKRGNSTKVALVKHDLENKHLGLDTADTIKITKTTRS